ncbi:Pheromone receptor [Mycena kentingensis (nom. inval.)]|nr:Pheromone receptor [Mycena kentingensis (nom. inval.)]
MPSSRNQCLQVCTILAAVCRLNRAYTPLNPAASSKSPPISGAPSPHSRVPSSSPAGWAPATALIFFLFFGFASEARKNYALALRAVAKAFWRVIALVGIRRPTTGMFVYLLSSPTHSRSPFVVGKPKRVPRPVFVASLHSIASKRLHLSRRNPFIPSSSLRGFPFDRVAGIYSLLRSPAFTIDASLRVAVDADGRPARRPTTYPTPDDVPDADGSQFPSPPSSSPLAGPSSLPAPSLDDLDEPKPSKKRKTAPWTRETLLATPVLKGPLSRSHRKRAKQRDLKIETFGHKVRQKALARRVHGALALQTAADALELPTALGSYVATQEYKKEWYGGKKKRDLAEFLRMGFTRIRWNGIDARPLVDAKGRIFARSRPADPTILYTLRRSTAPIQRSQPPPPEPGFPRRCENTDGGSSPRSPSACHVESALLADPDIQRMASFASAAFAFWAPDLYEYYREYNQKMKKEYPELRRPRPKRKEKALKFLPRRAHYQLLVKFRASVDVRTVPLCAAASRLSMEQLPVCTTRTVAPWLAQYMRNEAMYEAKCELHCARRHTRAQNEDADDDTPRHLPAKAGFRACSVAFADDVSIADRQLLLFVTLRKPARSLGLKALERDESPPGPRPYLSRTPDQDFHQAMTVDDDTFTDSDDDAHFAPSHSPPFTQDSERPMLVSESPISNSRSHPEDDDDQPQLARHIHPKQSPPLSQNPPRNFTASSSSASDPVN